MRACSLVLCLAAAGCSIPTVTEHLELESPPPELGRPGYVRTSAKIGAWAGAIGGAVASIALLPLTYPISLAADEPLGKASDEWLYLPVSVAASTGHFILGAPLDFLDYLFRRAWFEPERPQGYGFTPMKPPVRPGDTDTEADPGGGNQ